MWKVLLKGDGVGREGTGQYGGVQVPGSFWKNMELNSVQGFFNLSDLFLCLRFGAHLNRQQLLEEHVKM